MFLLKAYSVSVSGFPDAPYYAASPAKARAAAWRDYSHAYDHCSFKDFMKQSSVRRAQSTPPRFGDKIEVAGAEAYWVKSDGHYVWFVRPGQSQILLSHPNDVKELATCAT